MINWTKYFDKIYCILLIENANKKETLEKELDRVGILNSGIFEYQFKYNHNCDNALYNYLEEIAQNKNHTDFATNVNHFKVVQIAQYWKYNKILIIEDNVRFLKDLNKIELILLNRPEDADVILYDKIINESNTFSDINNYYSKFTSLKSTACYELSNKGIDKFKELLETNIEVNLDEYFENPSLYTSDLNFYCSKTNLAVQVNFNKPQYKYPTLIVLSQDYNLFENEILIYKEYIDNELLETYSNEVLITKDTIVNITQPIEPTTINICLTITTDVIDKTFPLLYSILKYSLSKFNVYIMLDKYTLDYYSPSFDPFRNERMNIKLIDSKFLDQVLNPVKVRSKRSKMTWARLLIPALIPEADRVLYLDYDTVVTNKGIEWLYNIDFEDNYLAGVKGQIYDFNAIKHKKSIDLLNIFEILTKFYVQSSVLMFNVKKIKLDKRHSSLVDLLTNEITSENIDILKQRLLFSNLFKKTKEILTFNYEEQSYLNYFFANKILEVSKIFCNNCFDENSNTILKRQYLQNEWKFKNEQDYLNKTVILHFGEKKPWETNDLPTYFQTKYHKRLLKKYDILKQESINYIADYYDKLG